MLALGVWWFREGSLIKGRQWHRKKCLERSTIGNSCYLILFWSIPYLLWKPWGKWICHLIHIPILSRTSACRQMGHLTWVLALQKDNCTRYPMTWAALRAHSLEEPVRINHLWCSGYNMLNPYCAVTTYTEIHPVFTSALVLLMFT